MEHNVVTLLEVDKCITMLRIQASEKNSDKGVLDNINNAQKALEEVKKDLGLAISKLNIEF
jgi:hypothetical protein